MRTFTIPDVYDGRKRVPNDARVRAYRCDTHTFVEESLLDANGNATFSSLPDDTDVVFYAVWGGITGLYGKHRWFFSHIVSVSEGGTGSSTAEGARTNLGLVIGTDVQAWDDDLDDIAALTPTDGNFIVGDGTNWTTESGATARESLGAISDLSFDAGEVTAEVATSNTRAAFDCGGV